MLRPLFKEPCMGTRSDLKVHQWHSILSPQAMGQFDNVECMVTRWLSPRSSQTRCYQYAVISRTQICLKIWPFVHQSVCSTYHSMISCLWCSVKGSQNHSCLAHSPYCFKRRRTVCADTCLVKEPIFWLRARDVAECSIKAMQVRCQSSRLPMIAGRLNPPQRSVWSSWTHLWHIFQTVITTQCQTS